MDSLKETDTYELPEGRKSVGGKWVYTVMGIPGEDMYKARYVAKGYSQVKDIDYKETFAPTASFASVRMLVQLAAQNDNQLHHMDVETAYFYMQKLIVIGEKLE